MHRSALVSRRTVWFFVLVAASVVSSSAFSCAVPLAAFGAAAALTLELPDALRFTGAVWMTNQAVGFACLRYPFTTECFAWGAVLGACAFASVFASHATARALRKRGSIAMSGSAFVAAFAAYEGGVLIVSAAGKAAAAFTAPIVLHILAVNLVGFVALLAANRLAVAAGILARRTPSGLTTAPYAV